METKTIINKQFTLKLRDWIKGVGIGAATAALVAVYELAQSAITTGALADLNLEKIGQAALAGLVAYLGKNFFEKDKVVEVKAGEDAKRHIDNES